MPTIQNISQSASPFASLFEALRQGTPELIMELPQSWVVLGEYQLFRGHSKVICKQYVTELHHLPLPVRSEFLNEVAMVSQAVEAATGACRINVEKLGNQTDHLHVHVFPRTLDEDSEMLRKPVWAYPDTVLKMPLTAFEVMQITAAVRGELARLVMNPT